MEKELESRGLFDACERERDKRKAKIERLRKHVKGEIAHLKA